MTLLNGREPHELAPDRKPYAAHFNWVIAKIRQLPASERTAMTNRQQARADQQRQALADR